MNEKEQQVKSYFDMQRKYYTFLKEKLGERFTGDCELASGQVLTSYDRYHLAELDDRLKFREIALECITGKNVFVRARMGRDYISGRVDFPYVIESENSEYEFSWALWNFNEVISVITSDINESSMGFTTDKPTTDGWYFVIFEPKDYPKLVYLHMSKYGISWGYDEEDDPEMMESSDEPKMILYKKAE